MAKEKKKPPKEKAKPKPSNKPVFGVDPAVYAGLPPEDQNAVASGAGTPEPAVGGYATPSPSSSNSGSSDSTLASDWYTALFGQYGLPSALQSQIVGILTKYASDPTLAVSLAQQTLRSSDWFKTTYPGFSSGYTNGLFTDENGYRTYLNDINQYYNQYLGRHVSGDELSGYLAAGYSPSYVGKLLAGQAYVTANRPEIQYLAGNFAPGTGQLSDSQLTSLGNQQAGIDTAAGQIQQKVLAKAQQIYTKMFQGAPATPSLSLGTQGLNSPSLLGGKPVPDVGA